MDLTHVPGDLTQVGQGKRGVPRVRPDSGQGLVPRPTLGTVRGLVAAVTKYHQEKSRAGKRRAGAGM